MKTTSVKFESSDLRHGRVMLMRTGRIANVRTSPKTHALSIQKFIRANSMLGSRIIGSFKAAKPLSAVEVDSTLTSLRLAIFQIQSLNPSTLSFEELYRAAYNLVIHKHGAKLYSALKEDVDSHLTREMTRLRTLEARRDFVDLLLRIWEEHNLIMRILADVMMYMDRNYTKQSNLPGTLDVGLKLFQTVVTRDEVVSGRFVTAVLELIHDLRKGSMRDRSIIVSLVSILTASSRGRECEDLFASLLLSRLVEGSTLYYRDKAGELVCNPIMFVEKGLEAFAFEFELATQGGFDGPVTWAALQTVLEKEWIMTYYKEIIDESFKADLEQANMDSLKKTHSLFIKTDQSRRYMVELFRDHSSTVFGDKDRYMIPTLIDRLTKYNSVIRGALSRDFSLELSAVLEMIFAKDSGVEISKQLSEFLDGTVRKSSKFLTEMEVEHQVDNALLVFRHISSKDVFEACYRHFLSRRLLSSFRSINLDLEHQLVGKLKLECGNSYTTKIEGMLADMLLSGEISSAWAKSASSVGIPFDIETRVLSTSLWSSNVKVVNMRISDPLMEQVAEKYSNFYAGKFTGRKLTWVLTQGSVDVKFNLNDSQSYLLTVSTIQALILLQFNGSTTTLTVAEICEQVGVTTEDIRRHLLSLAVNPRCRILTRQGDSTGSTLSGTDEFSVSESFDSKSRHVKVPMLVETAPVPELTSTNDIDTGMGIEQVVEEDRKHLIEAAIVRVMKTRRQLDHNGLLIEVGKILNHRFTPSVQMIKNRIENLIDREFIAKDNDDVKLYYYVA